MVVLTERKEDAVTEEIKTNEIDLEENIKTEDKESSRGNQNKHLLAQFWNLVSLDEQTRVKSVMNITKELKCSGKKEDLQYTVQRLVKGLSSSRKAARQGYATALTHVMNEFKDVTTDEILELISTHLAVKGSFKGQEERDSYFGQVFGLFAIVKSKLHNGDNVNFTVFKTIVENLLSLMRKKIYLQEVCGKGICDIIKYVDYSTYQEHLHAALEGVLNCGWSLCSPEDLMIVLTIEKWFLNDLPIDSFKAKWNNTLILHESNFKDLVKVLMDSTNIVHPRIHSLWDIILDMLLSADYHEQFSKFWKTVIEDGLLQSSHERKFLAMHILLNVSSRITFDQVAIIYSEAVIRCIINSCQSKENYLFKTVKQMLSELPAKIAANEDNKVASLVIKQLVGRHGHVCFDAITKSKTVEELASKLSNCVIDYVHWLKNAFLHGTIHNEEDVNEMLDKEVNACRTWVINQLSILVRCCKPENEEILWQIASFLFLNGYFNVLKKSKKDVLLKALPLHNVSNDIHHLCRQRFTTVLTELTHRHPAQVEGHHKHIIGGVGKDNEFYASSILFFAKKLLELPKYVQLLETWTPEIYEAFNNALELIATMKDDENSSSSVVNTKGVELLFVHAALQLFSNGLEAVDILQELHMCYKKAEEKKRLKKKEPHWSEVLTEILLGFISQPSNLMRQVVAVVFPTVIPHLTQEAFNLLINAIQPKQKHEDDGFDMDSDSDEQDVGNDAEQQINDNKEDENDEDVSSSSEDDESDESDMEIDEAFKAELKSALGDSAVNSEDDEADDDEDIDMDTCDPKLLQSMDQALAAVFKSKKQKFMEKKTKKNMKQIVLHFKLRVLDLLEIFIKKQPKDKKILQLLEPLLEVIKASQGHSDEQALFERTLGVFKNKLCHLHEYPSGTELDVDKVHEQIEKLLGMAKTASSALFVNYITQGIIYLIRVLRGNPELRDPSPLKTRSQHKCKDNKKDIVDTPLHIGCLDEKRIVACYKCALTEFMTKRSSHLQPILFVELIQRFPSLGWQLAPSLPQYLNTGCNNFRKMKSCELLKLLFSQKTPNIEECIASMIKPLSKNLTQAFAETKEEVYSLKARQFHDIVHLANIFIKEATTHKVTNQLELEEMTVGMRNALESNVVTRSASLLFYSQKFLVALENIYENQDIAIKKEKK